MVFKLTHIGEEVEEHQVQELATEEIPSQVVDIGPYFAAGVLGLAIIGFLVFRFLKRK